MLTSITEVWWCQVEHWVRWRDKRGSKLRYLVLGQISLKPQVSYSFLYIWSTNARKKHVSDGLWFLSRLKHWSIKAQDHLLDDLENFLKATAHRLYRIFLKVLIKSNFFINTNPLIGARLREIMKEYNNLGFLGCDTVERPAIWLFGWTKIFDIINENLLL